MQIKTFIANYQEAFGENARLPILFKYADIPLAQTEKTGGCFFKALQAVGQGHPISLHAGNIGCGGGKFYTGFSEMPQHIPAFVSTKERYKQTPEMVSDFIREIEVEQTSKKYLNFMRIDQADSLDDTEGILFLATPDMLSGLATWAFYDNNDPDAVTALFGSGCATVITYAVQENRKKGRRTFLGLFDPSVRPHINENELSFVIPYSRFAQMYATMRACCLFDTPAWKKVKQRIIRSNEGNENRPPLPETPSV